MSRAVRFAPLAILLLVLAGLIWRLATPTDNTVPSRLTGKTVPVFDLPAAVANKPPLSSRDLASGEPRLVNIFASWCVPCITEVRVLQELRRRGVRIDGVAIRDHSKDIASFLANHGDPYERIGSDVESKVQILLGSSGVPESFVVDGRGTIRYQHIGPIEPSQIPTILSALEAAK